MTDELLTKYVKMYHAAVFRMAYSYLKNTAEAEDVCQEAFLKLLSRQKDFPSDEDCRRWLLRITINLSKDLLKSARFARTEELCENIPYSAAPYREVWDAVKALPPDYRAVIHLYYYEGYSVKEISNILHKSVTTITTRLSRGRNKLKKLLTEDYQYEERI